MRGVEGVGEDAAQVGQDPLPARPDFFGVVVRLFEPQSFES